jgi:hypothetical protein
MMPRIGPPEERRRCDNGEARGGATNVLEEQ